jgi:hypothetical protein
MEQCQIVAKQPLASNVLAGIFAHDMERTVERLPFTIKRVTTEQEMRKAVQIRHSAYARHVPDFARSLLMAEEADYAEDTIVLLAESKLDGSALGSIRIRTNLDRPLDLEESIVLPAWLKGRRLVEATRLGVDEGRQGRVVKMALIKACFMYCQQNDIEWSVATARAGIDRQYEQLTFVDVFPELGPVPLRHVGNLPHRVMAFDVDTFEERWTQARHPLLNFFFNLQHPDIDIGGPAAMRMARVPMIPRRNPAIASRKALAMA